MTYRRSANNNNNNKNPNELLIIRLLYACYCRTNNKTTQRRILQLLLKKLLELSLRSTIVVEERNIPYLHLSNLFFKSVLSFLHGQQTFLSNDLNNNSNNNHHQQQHIVVAPLHHQTHPYQVYIGEYGNEIAEAIRKIQASTGGHSDFPHAFTDSELDDVLLAKFLSTETFGDNTPTFSGALFPPSQTGSDQHHQQQQQYSYNFDEEYKENVFVQENDFELVCDWPSPPSLSLQSSIESTNNNILSSSNVSLPPTLASSTACENNFSFGELNECPLPSPTGINGDLDLSELFSLTDMDSNGLFDTSSSSPLLFAMEEQQQAAIIQEEEQDSPPPLQQEEEEPEEIEQIQFIQEEKVDIYKNNVVDEEEEEIGEENDAQFYEVEIKNEIEDDGDCDVSEMYECSSASPLYEVMLPDDSVTSRSSYSQDFDSNSILHVDQGAFVNNNNNNNNNNTTSSRRKQRLPIVAGPTASSSSTTTAAAIEIMSSNSSQHTQYDNSSSDSFMDHHHHFYPHPTLPPPPPPHHQHYHNQDKYNHLSQQQLQQQQQQTFASSSIAASEPIDDEADEEEEEEQDCDSISLGSSIPSLQSHSKTSSSNEYKAPHRAPGLGEARSRRLLSDNRIPIDLIILLNASRQELLTLYSRYSLSRAQISVCTQIRKKAAQRRASYRLRNRISTQDQSKEVQLYEAKQKLVHLRQVLVDKRLERNDANDELFRVKRKLLTQFRDWNHEPLTYPQWSVFVSTNENCLILQRPVHGDEEEEVRLALGRLDLRSPKDSNSNSRMKNTACSSEVSSSHYYGDDRNTSRDSAVEC